MDVTEIKELYAEELALLKTIQAYFLELAFCISSYDGCIEEGEDFFLSTTNRNLIAMLFY